MALPVTIPNAFANATASIPLSQLDTNFNTLANAVNGISDGSETLANVTATVANITTANVGALNTSGQVVFNDAGADVDFRVEGDTDANLLFVDASTDRIGIGTNTPAEKLSITGSIALSGGIALQNNQGPYWGTGQAYISYNTSTNNMSFGTNSVADRVIIDSSGNVGIGTGSPANKLDVNGQITASSGFNSGDALLGNGTLISGGATSDCGIRGGGNILFAPSSTAERARITSAGLIVTGSVDAKVTASGTRCFEAWNQATSGDNVFITFYTEGGTGTFRGSIDYNRGAGLVRYNTTSDATLKNIIGDSDGAKSVEILNSTRIREYAWKDDETQKPQIGVIAQELYETYKGAVSVGGDVEKERDVTEEVEEEYTDENGETQTHTVTKVVGKETYTEYCPWGVDKTAFTFHLVAGWQAHEKLINQQAETIAALEARIAALENA